MDVHRMQSIIIQQRNEQTEAIEYRQDEGTLDSDRVKNWARFSVRTVEWSRQSSTKDMQAFWSAERDRQQAGQIMMLWDFVDTKLGLVNSLHRARMERISSG